MKLTRRTQTQACANMLPAKCWNYRHTPRGCVSVSC